MTRLPGSGPRHQWNRLGLESFPDPSGNVTVLLGDGFPPQAGADEGVMFPAGLEIRVGLKGRDRRADQLRIEFTIRQGGDMFSLLFAHG
jgi:hypothetical protein